MNSKPICQLTHSQLLSGTCPWCRASIGSNEESVSEGDRRWNIQQLAVDLESMDKEIRWRTVRNLFGYGPPLAEAIPLLSKAIRDPVDTIRALVLMGIFQRSQEFSDRQAAELEAGDAISNHPVAVRLVLLSYYFKKQFTSEMAKDIWRQHLLWLFSNAPETDIAALPVFTILSSQDPVGYEEAKKIWLAHVEATPESPAILFNAATFFMPNDFDLAERLFIEGGKRDPKNPFWRDRLVELSSLRAQRNEN